MNQELIKDFNFKKKFGQNFLKDENILRNIVTKSEVDKDTLVIEIGIGAAYLTYYLSEKAKYVLGYDIWNEPSPGGFLEDFKNIIAGSPDIYSVLPLYKKVNQSEEKWEKIWRLEKKVLSLYRQKQGFEAFSLQSSFSFEHDCCVGMEQAECMKFSVKRIVRSRIGYKGCSPK